MNIRLSLTENVTSKNARRRKKLPINVEVALAEASILGREFARNTAPFYTGEVRANILNFKQNKTSWVVISKTPASDKGFPVNVLFETGDYSDVTGNQPRSISTLFFMQKTAEFLKREFKRRLDFEVKEAIK